MLADGRTHEQVEPCEDVVMNAPFNSIRRSGLVRVFAAAALVIAATASAQAQLTWDHNGATPLSDGPGTWDTTTVRWIGSSGTTLWTDSNTASATFGVGSGTPGTVTVSGVRTLNRLTFNATSSGNYQLLSGTITLAGSNPTINANRTAVINSVLAGSSGFIYNGILPTRNFQLRAVNTYTGITEIRSGQIGLFNLGGLGASGDGNHTLFSGTATTSTGSNSHAVSLGYGLGTGGGTVAESFVMSGTGAFTGGGSGGLLFYNGDASGGLGVTVTGSITINSDSVSELRIGTFTGTDFITTGTVAGGVSTAFNDKILSLNASGTFSTGNTLTIATNAINLPGSASRINVMSVDQPAGTGNSQVVMAVAGNTAGVLEVSSGGKLRTDVANAFSNTMAVQIGSGSTGGIWNLNGNNQSIGNLSSAGTLTSGSAAITSAAAATLSVNQTGTTTYGAALQGALSLTKGGAGTLTLAGANLYSGATTIAGGTLALGAAGSFANSSSIIVGNAGSSGAVLDLTAKTGSFDIGAGQTLGGGGTVQLASSGTLNVLGLLSPGNSPGLLTFDAGTTVLSGTTLMEISGLTRATGPTHGPGFYDAINVIDSGVLTFGGLLQLAFSQEFDDNDTFNLFTPSGGGSLAGNFSGVNVTGSFYTGLSWSQSGSKWTSTATTGGQTLEFNATTGALVIVPEPGALALAGIGVAAAAWAARRRRAGGR
jgi:autotransporter-associated beta strand protein